MPTENQLFNTLSTVFQPGPWLLLPQVRNTTGYKRRIRTADALAVSIWPSRGIYFTGVEIKVSRSDWLRELKDVAKSSNIQGYCRHWYIATPPEIVVRTELPPTWGLIECREKTAKIVVQAPPLEPVAPGVDFVAAVLRAATKAMVPRNSTTEWKHRVATARDAGYEAGKRDATESASRRLTDLTEAITLFEESSGVKIGSRWDAGDIGIAVKAALAMPQCNPVPDLTRTRDRLQSSLATIERVLTEITN